MVSREVRLLGPVRRENSINGVSSLSGRLAGLWCFCPWCTREQRWPECRVRWNPRASGASSTCTQLRR